ncbi:MAG: DoxX family protein, partial [Roseiarcus sp.]
MTEERPPRAAMERARALMRWIMAAFYFAAGVLHVAAPDRFLPIVPDFVPFPRDIVIITGLCEIAGAIALVSVRLRRLAGAMLALYAICVFPANIKHAFGAIHIPGLPDSWWYHGPR